jgi:hypothetical protein
MTMIMLFFTAPVLAQQMVIDENPSDMKVTYLEGDNDVMLFNLRYNNNTGTGFKLMVLNETGDVLFQSNYSGKKFKKKIKLARLTDNDDVTFLIRSPQKNVQLSRRVKVTSKVVDDSSLHKEL